MDHYELARVLNMQAMLLSVAAFFAAVSALCFFVALLLP